ncbi:MAG: DNA polymerase III subunit chi [Boseongicola sp.]
MGAAYFYHLTERPLEAALPVLIGKALQAKWRVAVTGSDTARLDRLDLTLWNGDGFLPHGLDGGPHDADQPVLLTNSGLANDPHCVMAIDGVEIAADDVASRDRYCILFDGADESAVDIARAQWRALTEAGVTAQYWAEENGRWVKRSETGSPE